MSLTPKPYEPTCQSLGNRKWTDRLVDWIRGPFPIRVGAEARFQWIVDSLIALVLWIAGTLIAGAFAVLTPFLGELAYPVGLIVGWFPIGMWMHYCRVADQNARTSLLLIVGLLTFLALGNGARGLLSLPLGCAILLLVLPLEMVSGKIVFGRLPSSSGTRRIQTEQ